MTAKFHPRYDTVVLTDSEEGSGGGMIMCVCLCLRTRACVADVASALSLENVRLH